MATAYKAFPASSTATDPVSGLSYVSNYDMFTVGAGYLDLQAALQSTHIPAAGLSAVSPSALYDSITGTVILSNGTPIIAPTQTVWGTKSVWGAGTIWGLQTLLGTQTVWGTKTVWGAQSIFATSDQAAAEAIAIQGEP